MKQQRNGLITTVVLIIVFFVLMFVVSTSSALNEQLPSGIYSLNAVEFKSKIDRLQSNEIILDIRTPQEFDSGKINGAVNIDFYSPTFQKRLEELDRKKTYFVYCNSGNRSKAALGIMRNLGFQRVYELSGGIQEWSARNFPICKSC